MSRVIELHYVCDDWKNVKSLGEEIFISGDWVISKGHLSADKIAKGIKFALHQSRSELSYLQGEIIDWEKSPDHEKRVIFKFKFTNTPMKWEGHATGERGYLWEKDEKLTS